MPVELFLLEENQITHTFRKLLMTAFQSASGWLSVMICIFIYSSYIKKFTPVRSWQSVSIFNLFGENSLLADIIQISFYQKSGWHNRWRYKKYAADKQRILMRDRDFCTSIKGMEITILIPDTLNCTWSPWVIVRRRHKWQLQNFLYYPGWHQNFYFCLRNHARGQTKQLSEQESSKISRRMVVPAGTLLDIKTNICSSQLQQLEERLQCAGGAEGPLGAGLPVRFSQALTWSSSRKLIDAYYSSQKYYAFENTSGKTWALWLRFSAMSSNTMLNPGITVTHVKC